MDKVKRWLRNQKIWAYLLMFFLGFALLFISSAGWGVGFMGWHIILAGVLMFPFGYDLGKVG